MGGLFHFIFLLLIVEVAANFNAPEFALFKKKTEFWRLDNPIQKDLDVIIKKTITKLEDYKMNIPSKIALHRINYSENNVFMEPFLVGDSSKLHAYHFVSAPLADWCSGILAARSTEFLFEKENLSINVEFDCGRVALIPSLKSVIGTVLVILFAFAVSWGASAFFNKPNKPGLERCALSPIPMETCFIDPDEVIAEATFMDRVEKWDNSNCD